MCHGVHMYTHPNTQYTDSVYTQEHTHTHTYIIWVVVYTFNLNTQKSEGSGFLCSLVYIMSSIPARYFYYHCETLSQKEHCKSINTCYIVLSKKKWQNSASRQMQLFSWNVFDPWLTESEDQGPTDRVPTILPPPRATLLESPPLFLLLLRHLLIPYPHVCHVGTPSVSEITQKPKM